jgi:hypothetical protein
MIPAFLFLAFVATASLLAIAVAVVMIARKLHEVI